MVQFISYGYFRSSGRLDPNGKTGVCRSGTTLSSQFCHSWYENLLHLKISQHRHLGNYAEDSHGICNLSKPYISLALGSYKILINSSLFCSKPYLGYFVAKQAAGAQFFQSCVFRHEIDAEICRFASGSTELGTTLRLLEEEINCYALLSCRFLS